MKAYTSSSVQENVRVNWKNTKRNLVGVSMKDIVPGIFILSSLTNYNRYLIFFLRFNYYNFDSRQQNIADLASKVLGEKTHDNSLFCTTAGSNTESRCRTRFGIGFDTT